MRIAWITPTHAASAVARYSEAVVTALRKRCEVDVGAPGPLAVRRRFDPDFYLSSARTNPRHLERYDAIVYNLGDHFDFHAEIFALSRRIAGVVVLHDRWLGGFFHHWHEVTVDGPNSFGLRVQELYGAQTARDAVRFFARRPFGSEWIRDDRLLRWSFTELALAGQKAAIVHSAAHATDLSRLFTGPVLQLPFPTYSEWLQAPTRRGEAARLTVLSAGQVNPNRHIHRVVEVLAADSDLAQRIRYVVIGRIAPYYGDMLARRISQAGLADTVKLLGPVPPRVFAALLSQADIHVNLRLPSLESGSASAAEQLATGRPLLVYNTGSFAELPDDAVVKVPPDDGEAMRAALWMLVTNQRRADAIGAAGRAVAEQRSIGAYAARLIDFLPQALDWPWRGFKHRIDAELAVMGVDCSMASAARVERAVASLLPATSLWRDGTPPPGAA